MLTKKKTLKGKIKPAVPFYVTLLLRKCLCKIHPVMQICLFVMSQREAAAHRAREVLTLLSKLPGLIHN